MHNAWGEASHASLVEGCNCWMSARNVTYTMGGSLGRNIAGLAKERNKISNHISRRILTALWRKRDLYIVKFSFPRGEGGPCYQLKMLHVLCKEKLTKSQCSESVLARRVRWLWFHDSQCAIRGSYLEEDNSQVWEGNISSMRLIDR